MTTPGELNLSPRERLQSGLDRWLGGIVNLNLAISDLAQAGAGEDTVGASLQQVEVADYFLPKGVTVSVTPSPGIELDPLQVLYDHFALGSIGDERDKEASPFTADHPFTGGRLIRPEAVRSGDMGPILGVRLVVQQEPLRDSEDSVAGVEVPVKLLGHTVVTPQFTIEPARTPFRGS